MRTVVDNAPSPGSGETRVRVLAASVAYANVLMRAGRHPSGPRSPYVPGWDVGGVVEAIGPGVDAEWRDARVAALVLQGGYASRVLVPAADLVSVPNRVDLRLAAACRSTSSPGACCTGWPPSVMAG